MSQQNKPSGCGCANIPISVILIFLGAGYWAFNKYGIPDPNLLLAKLQGKEVTPAFTPTPSLPETTIADNPTLPNSPIVTTKPKVTNKNTTNNNSSLDNLPRSPVITSKSSPEEPKKEPLHVSPTPDTETNLEPQTKTIVEEQKSLDKWSQKDIRGIYFSRYQITNNASEQMIRDRVKYYKSQGINTLIHGVWGNACTMYNSEVMQQTLGFKSCPNLFRDKWLDWLIDEAHKQGMEVHAYFEKGIKIDENSPIFDLAVANKWLVPGVDNTYAGVEHYVLDIENSEVATFFQNIVVEFVQKYPEIDAVQWDDYLGYHAELPGKVDRTESLTGFVTTMIQMMKKANPNVSFDICHHNPYWGKRYFAADWQKWGVDRVFIQAYNEKGFAEELNYVKKHDGIAITDKQFHRLPQLLDDEQVQSILVFPLSGKPEQTAAQLNTLLNKNN